MRPGEMSRNFRDYYSFTQHAPYSGSVCWGEGLQKGKSIISLREASLLVWNTCWEREERDPGSHKTVAGGLGSGRAALGEKGHLLASLFLRRVRARDGGGQDRMGGRNGAMRWA